MIDQVSGKVGITKKEVGNATMEAIQKALSKGEKVILVGFGTFRILQRKARRVVNPQEKLFKYQQRRFLSLEWERN